MARSGESGHLPQSDMAELLAVYAAGAPLRQQRVKELAVFYAQLESASQVSAEHVIAAENLIAVVDMETSSTPVDAKLEVCSSGIDWTAFAPPRVVAAIGPLIHVVTPGAARRQWISTSKRYLAAAAALVAVSFLVAFGVIFGNLMPTINHEAKTVPPSEAAVGAPPASVTPPPIALSPSAGAAPMPLVREPPATPSRRRHKRAGYRSPFR
jgi:hypothetical protein